MRQCIAGMAVPISSVMPCVPQIWHPIVVAVHSLPKRACPTVFARFSFADIRLSFRADDVVGNNNYAIFALLLFLHVLYLLMRMICFTFFFLGTAHAYQVPW